jgi:hypothetical protein
MTSNDDVVKALDEIRMERIIEEYARHKKECRG